MFETAANFYYSLILLKNYAKTLVKQVNPRFGIRLGEQLGEEKLDAFSETQITQLYELFMETTKKDRQKT